MKIDRLIKQHLPTKGSSHRSTLVFLGFLAYSKKPINTKVIKVAALVEAFYWATAWLDDFADQNTQRQNKKTFGSSGVGLAGIYISNYFYGRILKALKEVGLDKKILNKIEDCFVENFIIINRGQAKDLLYADMDLASIRIKDYLNLIQETTGYDIGYCLKMGTLLAGIRPKESKLLFDFGVILGTLAQMRDDVLDYCDVKVGGEYIIGKQPFRDQMTNKKRLPLLLTKDRNLRKLDHNIYSQIRTNYIKPLRRESKDILSKSNLENPTTKQILLDLLDFWSDIDIFEKIQYKKI